MKTLLYVILVSSLLQNVTAQVGIGTITPQANLDIVASNSALPSSTDGVLIPRIDDFPLTQPALSQNGMLVFLTGNGVPAEGFYYWTGTLWANVSTAGGNTLDNAYDQGGTGLGRIINATNGPVDINGTADASGVTNTGLLEIGNTLRLDANEIITNTGQELFLQFTNDSDLSIDDTTFFVDGTNNRVGIGTFQPDYSLHVAAGRAEVTEANEATGAINSGVLEIANSLRLDGDEIITNTGTTLNLQNGNNGDLSVDGSTLYVDASTNNVGIGTVSPSKRLHLRHNNSTSSGFGISNINGSGGLWHFHVRSNLGQRLELHFNNGYRGSFDATSGFYTSVSDKNLKNNITRIAPVIEKVRQLNVVNYALNKQQSDRKYVGLIAQEVKEIFPHLVYGESQTGARENNEYYTMDYAGFGILAIKAIQEQQTTIETLIQRIEILENK